MTLLFTWYETRIDKKEHGQIRHRHCHWVDSTGIRTQSQPAHTNCEVSLLLIQPPQKGIITYPLKTFPTYNLHGLKCLCITPAQWKETEIVISARLSLGSWIYHEYIDSTVYYDTFHNSQRLILVKTKIYCIITLTTCVSRIIPLMLSSRL